MTRPDGMDQSWGVADPAQAAAAGIRVVSMYLSRDPSKNVTPDKVKAYHHEAIGVILNWEDQAGAPLKGAAQGRADALEAVQQAKALFDQVGYPPDEQLTIYFSCDRDVTGTELEGPVAAYYEAAQQVCHGTRFTVELAFGDGCYGSRAVVHYLAAAGLTDGEWQTYAWSGGVLDPAADYYQFLNGQTLGGASVDYDRIIHPAQLGAWWPPGHSPQSTSAAPIGELTMDAEVKAAFAAQGHKIDVLFDLVHSALSPVIDGKTTQVSVDTIVARRVAPLAAQNAALQAQVNALAKLQAGESLTADEVRAEAKQGAEDALAGYQLTLTPPAAK